MSARRPIPNRERVINIRASDKAIKRHPPAGDLIRSQSDKGDI
jgi:hypothetical protein